MAGSWKKTASIALPVLCIATNGCWFGAASMPGISSSSMHSASGTLGKHQFTKASEVAAFNTRATDWLLMKGFVRDTSLTPSEMKSKGWSTPGVVLVRGYGSAGQFYVFVPECYNPKSHLQIISYDIELRGTTEEVARLTRETEQVEAEYRREFDSGH
jgi:hypothetical protein